MLTCAAIRTRVDCITDVQVHRKIIWFIGRFHNTLATRILLLAHGTFKMIPRTTWFLKWRWENLLFKGISLLSRIFCMCAILFYKHRYECIHFYVVESMLTAAIVTTPVGNQDLRYTRFVILDDALGYHWSVWINCYIHRPILCEMNQIQSFNVIVYHIIYNKFIVGSPAHV